MLGRFVPAAIKRSRFGNVLRRIGKPLMPGWVDEGRKLVQGPELVGIIESRGLNTPDIRLLLNAGGGEGLYSGLLLQLSPVAKVIEIDLSYGSWHRSVEDPRQNVAAASLTAIPFADQSFDFILCSEVLEHIPEDHLALDELSRVLAPGGHLLISVPTPPAVFDRAHVREGYRPHDLERMLRERGLEIIETRFCMHTLFQFFLRAQTNGPTPKIVVWTLSRLDRLLKMGSPMDLIILARVKGTADTLS